MKEKESTRPQPWKVLESRRLFDKPWFNVRQEKLLMPNGNTVEDYFVLDYDNWVNIIAITKERKFVLVEQYRHGIEKVCMELCAGVCEASDNSLLHSAQRELLEETGYGNGSWTEYMSLAPNASACSNYSTCFIARDVELVADHQTLDDSEDLAVHLLSYDQLYHLLENGKIIQATMAAPLWKFMLENKNEFQ